MNFPTLSIITLALAAANAQAITIRDDVADSNYTALGNDARYNSVGSVQVQSGGNWFHICGATLISNDLLATAGNCNQYAGTLPYRFVAAPANINNTSSPQTQTIAISQFYTHPDAANPIGLDKNLGLMRLSAPISTDAGSVLQPAPLDMTLNAVGQVGTFVGYGRTGTGLTGDTSLAGQRRGAQNMLDSAGAVVTTPGIAGSDTNTASLKY